MSKETYTKGHASLTLEGRMTQEALYLKKKITPSNMRAIKSYAICSI